MQTLTILYVCPLCIDKRVALSDNMLSVYNWSQMHMEVLANGMHSSLTTDSVPLQESEIYYNEYYDITQVHGMLM